MEWEIYRSNSVITAVITLNPHVVRFTQMTLLEAVTSKMSAEFSHFIAAMSDSSHVGDFVLLYGQSDLPERNETYEIQTYLPGWVAIGDDGSGTALS